MSYQLNQICLMSTESDLTRFWANSYGLVSDNYKIIYATDIIQEHGYHFLFEKIENDIIENKISLLLIDISAPQYDPFAIFDLKKKYGLMVVLLAIDDEMKFSWISSSYSSIADLIITSDYVSVDRYRQSGINAHFLPLPVYIPNEVPLKKSELAHGVSFIGRRDKDKPIRERYLRVLENEIEISIFGNKGPNDPQYLSTDKMYSIFRNSLVNLNFTGITVYSSGDNALFKRIRGMKIRPFEVVAAGGMCISEFSISLAKCFKDGVEIVFFTNERDMVEKIKYYLTHQDEARKIAIAGLDKVTKKYSNKATAKQLKSLIKKSQAYLGVDLYGAPQRVQVSRWFAYSLIERTLTNNITLLIKGRFHLFLNDTMYLIQFIRHLPNNIGIFCTLQVVIIGLYRSVKTIILTKILTKAKFWKSHQ